ncbi:hypothetical protein CKO50_14560 [Pseudoalteromonas sp. HM-SA03]|uniref:hypothetical protein n=1 Tax=Pseudoalteromonas sp. HM-SA03 TaxID=2029678 RepID=UPI000BAE15F7|nr:hypothetical protein [Pseudoalteromonas sp. HM-SA03]PAY00649.1 hypothetical protein CKO50_14560 [Pseudoalteromonas sp. HM-SA03]
MIANKKSLLALSVASALTLSGCFSDDDNNVTITPPEPTDPVVVAPDAPAALPLVISASVVDKESTNVLPATIKFFENGELSQNIVDVNGDVLTEVTAEDGTVVFAKKDGADISEVTVIVTADNYLSKSFVLGLDASEGVKAVNTQLPLLSLNAGGIVSDVKTALVEGGTTAEPITAGKADGKAAAGANIKAGTQLLNAAGEPVSGSISLNVAGADASSNTAAAIIPEGLNGAGGETVAVPAGIATVIMADADGNKVKSFGGDSITVSLSIPASTMLNGEKIKTNDTLPYSSYNEDTGVWTEEDSVVTIGEYNADADTFNATLETKHLSSFVPVVRATPCTSDVVVNFTGEAVPASGLFLRAASSMLSFALPVSGGVTSLQIASGDNAAQYGFTADSKADVEILDSNGSVWGSANNASLCGSFDIALANANPTVEETFTLTAACSNDSAQTIDMSNAFVTYALTNKAPLVATSSGGGEFALANLVQGATYSINVVPRVEGASPQTFEITADGNGESGNVPVTCEVTTGA